MDSASFIMFVIRISKQNKEPFLIFVYYNSLYKTEENKRKLYIYIMLQ